MQDDAQRMEAFVDKAASCLSDEELTAYHERTKLNLIIREVAVWSGFPEYVVLAKYMTKRTARAKAAVAVLVRDLMVFDKNAKRTIYARLGWLQPRFRHWLNTGRRLCGTDAAFRSDIDRMYRRLNEALDHRRVKLSARVPRKRVLVPGKLRKAKGVRKTTGGSHGFGGAGAGGGVHGEGGGAQAESV